MAEERLIDDDKDRKYKIRINEDGEEELVIDDRVEEPEVEEQPEFDMPDFDEDDEEAAVMTPEQLAARDRAREEAEAKRLNDIAELTSRALSIMDEGRYDDAVYLLDEARSLGDDGRVCALQVVALTKNYTDFSNNYYQYKITFHLNQIKFPSYQFLLVNHSYFYEYKHYQPIF